MEARLEQQLCVIENSGGAYVWHAPLPEWPSPVVNNEPRPHVVTCSCNKLAFAHRYQPVSALNLLHGEARQYSQIEPRPSWVWT